MYLLSKTEALFSEETEILETEPIIYDILIFAGGDSSNWLSNTGLYIVSVFNSWTALYHFLSATSTHFKWELMLYCLHCPTLNKVFLLFLTIPARPVLRWTIAIILHALYTLGGVCLIIPKESHMTTSNFVPCMACLTQNVHGLLFVVFLLVHWLSLWIRVIR